VNVYTPGDLISFGVFLAEVAVLCLIASLTLFVRPKRILVADDPENAESTERAWSESSVSPELLYDRAFEANRDVNAEIQGVENELLAILAAVAAVVVLTIDKMPDLGMLSLSCVAAAFIVCGFGYLRGNAAWRRKFADPRRFFYDLIVDPDEAHQSGAQDLIDALAVTRRLLIEKRRWAMVAIVALLVGTLAGGFQKVIHFERNDALQRRCGSGDPPTCRARSSREIPSPICCAHAPGLRLVSSSRRARP
jgi:hypothetical protein